MTALICAARDGKADTIKLLLEAGASTEAKGPVSKRISIFFRIMFLLLF